jgi:hypothetical protein
MEILKKYETDVPMEECLHPTMNGPAYVLPPDFNVFKDVVLFDWHKKDSFLDKVKKRINTPEMKKKIKDADRLFDIISFFMLLFHLFL